MSTLVHTTSSSLRERSCRTDPSSRVNASPTSGSFTQRGGDGPNLWRTLGFRRTDWEPGGSTVEWDATLEYGFVTPAGPVIQGGLVTAILDSAMGGACWTVLEQRRGVPDRRPAGRVLPADAARAAAGRRQGGAADVEGGVLLGRTLRRRRAPPWPRAAARRSSYQRRSPAVGDHNFGETVASRPVGGHYFRGTVASAAVGGHYFRGTVASRPAGGHYFGGSSGLQRPSEATTSGEVVASSGRGRALLRGNSGLQRSGLGTRTWQADASARCLAGATVTPTKRCAFCRGPRRCARRTRVIGRIGKFLSRNVA